MLGSKGGTLFDLDAALGAVTRSFVVSAWKPVPQENVWQAWDEPHPADRRDPGIASVEPIEQLSLTKDSTDYCWYSSSLQVDDAGAQEIVIPYGGGFFYLYVDK